MSIYTKTGDRGTTSLYEPDPSKRNRVSKDSLRIEAIGAVDEANSYLGIATATCDNTEIRSLISHIQTDLFQIGAILSQAKLPFTKSRTLFLEEHIDKLETELPQLRNFVMPEGTLSATSFLYARSLIRKAERRIVSLSQSESVSNEILKYINRLSDLLFMVFRFENSNAKQTEKLWIGKKTSSSKK